MRAAIAIVVLLASCAVASEDEPVAADSSGSAESGEPVDAVAIRGNAFAFAIGGGWIEDGRVSILERPEIPPVTTDAEGAFAFEGLPRGMPVTLVLDKDGFPPIQTGTFAMDADVERATFQAPDQALYDLLADLVAITPDPGACQVATTVTRRGNSLYDETPGTHGEPAATVTIEPPLPAEHGPIYFNLITYNVIYPDPMLTETTDDGGVLYLNVPPGTYVLRAHKADTTFTEATLQCRAGWLVNASPPWGLQAIEGGVGPRPD